jgi:glycosyltransferase involved in cell wall biosynthesis
MSESTLTEADLMPNCRKLRVALDCRIDDPRQGVGTAVLSLAHALSQSGILDQEYIFLVHEDVKDWLVPHAFGPCEVVGIPRSQPSPLKRLLRSIPPLRALREKLPRKAANVPVSDGYVESHDFDVVHFPTQIGYRTALPTIYQPWDLQHLHHPEFFAASDVLNREKHYRALCDQAHCICVQTQWSKNDLVHQYKIDPERIAVIPWGSVLEAHQPPSPETVQEAVSKFGLPDKFFFYPAATWPHKNHELIIRALHTMKSVAGKAVPVYFTGSSTPYRKSLDALARQLGVANQLHYLGFIGSGELQAVYATATAMIFPSRFEGFGLPVLEAFSVRLPVLCARATVLPEVAREAALYFDPDSPAELAECMRSVLHDEGLRRDLAGKGESVLGRYSMKDTARNFQRLYSTLGLRSRKDFSTAPADPGNESKGGR